MRYDFIQDQAMGIAGIPGTFPTGKIKTYLNTWSFDYSWTRSIVNDLYRWYKEAVETKGLPAYIKGTRVNKFPTMKFIKDNTAVPIDQIQLYLEGLSTLAKSGEISNKWLAIKKPESSKFNILEKAGDIAEKTARTVKWVAIIGGGVAALYFLSPLFKARLLKLKRKPKPAN